MKKKFLILLLFFVLLSLPISNISADSISSCKSFGPGDCETNDKFACVWVNKKIDNRTWSYCNFDDLTYVKCGGAWDIPNKLPELTSFFVNLLKIVTPIILIVLSIITLIKATASSNADQIKKAQNTLIKRIIAAAMVFFVIQITQFVMIKVAEDSDAGGVTACLSCFLNNTCDTSVYYKTNVLGEYHCTFADGTEMLCDENPNGSINGSSGENSQSGKTTNSSSDDKEHGGGGREI